MSEQDFKRKINQIVIGIIVGIVLNVVFVGWGVYNASYKGSIVNEYQDKAIQENKENIKENSKQFGYIYKQLNKLETLIKKYE